MFVNLAWNELYPEACVKHLERSHFDYCPVILSLHQEVQLNIPRPFWFQPMWLSHPSFLAWLGKLGQLILACLLLSPPLPIKLRSEIKIFLEMFSNRREEFMPDLKVFNLLLPTTFLDSLSILKKCFELNTKRLLSRKRSFRV